MRFRRSVILSSTQGAPDTDSNGAIVSWTFSFVDPVVNEPSLRPVDRGHAVVGLVDSHIPMSFYVVNAANSALRILRDGTPFDMTLREGNYSPSTLVDELNAELAEKGLTLEAAYTARRLGLSFVRAEGDVATYAIGGAGTTASRVLGLVPGEALAFAPPASVLELPRPVDLAGPRSIFVLCNVPLESSDSSGRASAVLAAIPATSRSGTLQYWQPTRVLYHRTGFDQLNSMTIRLVDENFAPVDLRGVAWTMEIEFA